MTDHSNHRAKTESCELIISSCNKLDLKFQNFRQKYDFFLKILNMFVWLKMDPSNF